MYYSIILLAIVVQLHAMSPGYQAQAEPMTRAEALKRVHTDDTLALCGQVRYGALTATQAHTTLADRETALLYLTTCVAISSASGEYAAVTVDNAVLRGVLGHATKPRTVKKADGQRVTHVSFNATGHNSLCAVHHPATVALFHPRGDYILSIPAAENCSIIALSYNGDVVAAVMSDNEIVFLKPPESFPDLSTTSVIPAAPWHTIIAHRDGFLGASHAEIALSHGKAFAATQGLLPPGCTIKHLFRTKAQDEFIMHVTEPHGAEQLYKLALTQT